MSIVSGGKYNAFKWHLQNIHVKNLYEIFLKLFVVANSSICVVGVF